MPALTSFEYAVLRIVPRVERQEFINTGVIVFCLRQDYLACLLHWDERRIGALWLGLDIAEARRHFEAFPRVCAGDPEAGPIARLTRRERFHWLVAPRSTVVQISAVHSGLCEEPAASLERLFGELVLTENTS